MEEDLGRGLWRSWGRTRFDLKDEGSQKGSVGIPSSKAWGGCRCVVGNVKEWRERH